MTQFSAAPPQLHATAASTATRADDLRTELDRLRGEAEFVLDGQWSGCAAHAFGRAWTDWHAGARGVVAVLDHLAALLADCARGYAGSDAAGADELIRAAL